MKYLDSFKEKISVLKEKIFPSKSVKLSKKQKISLVSLLVITLSLPLTIYLVEQRQVYRNQIWAAGPKARPTNVQITNLHGGGFSVSWTSSHPANDTFRETTGFVVWRTDQNNLNQKAFDDRGENISSITHHVSLFNLNPNTTYYFKIKSGPDLYGPHPTKDAWVAGGNAKKQVSPSALELLDNPQPIYGYIKNQGGNKIEGSLVYVQLKKNDDETKSALMSTVTKAGEGWVMDVKNSRSGDLNSFFSYDDDDQVLIQVQSGQNGTGSANFTINGCSPAQDIILTPPPSPSPTPTTRYNCSRLKRACVPNRFGRYRSLEKCQAVCYPSPSPSLTPSPSPSLEPSPEPSPSPTSSPSPTPTTRYRCNYRTKTCEPSKDGYRFLERCQARCR